MSLVSIRVESQQSPSGDEVSAITAIVISVDHPRVVENYRSAHSIALRLGRSEASMEDLRTAMIHYRSLFDELV
jgi:hypothetical protein